MAGWLVIVVTLIYLYCSIAFFWQGNYAMGIVYFGYAFANVGLIMMAFAG